MDFKFNYNTEEEKNKILKENKGLYLKECVCLLNEKYLILTDIKLDDFPLTEMEIIQVRISNLEEENKSLKQELSITQDAINELIFNSLNM